MSGKMRTVFTALLIVIMCISVAVLVLYIFSYSSCNGALDDRLINEDHFIGWTYILLGATIISVVLFAIVNIFMNIKNALKSIIGVVILLIIVAFAYSVSSDSLDVILNPAKLDFEFTHAMSKNADAGIFTVYILLGLVVLSAFYAEISKIFK